MDRSSEATAAVRRNILVALLAGMRVCDSDAKRIDLLLRFYREPDEEQERLSRTQPMLRPTRLWDTDDRWLLEEKLGLYMSQGSNLDLDMSQMTDVGRMVWRVLMLDVPEEANGDLEGLADRSENWGADGAAFLRRYAELSATVP